MIQFQEIARTDGRTDREGRRTDPSGYDWGPIIRATKLFNDYNRYLTTYFQQELIFKPPLKRGFSCR